MRSLSISLLAVSLLFTISACSDSQESVVKAAAKNGCEDVDEFILQIFRDAKKRYELMPFSDVPEDLRFAGAVHRRVRNDTTRGVDLGEAFVKAVPASYWAESEAKDETMKKVLYTRRCEPYIKRLFAIEAFYTGILTGDK